MYVFGVAGRQVISELDNYTEKSKIISTCGFSSSLAISCKSTLPGVGIDLKLIEIVCCSKSTVIQLGTGIELS